MSPMTNCLAIILLPLFGALISGFGLVSRQAAHWLTSSCVGLSALLSLYIYQNIMFEGSGDYQSTVYTWLTSGGMSFEIGFLIDPLSVTMMVVITIVSSMIHIYTIGYMRDDPGYRRFFSYISLFTFAMLMLVMSNNFMQLFFGWEAVGLVSYLLIGFWYKKESAIFASLKAFLVNRVGDLGFLVGIALIAMYFNTLDYMEIFKSVPKLVDLKITMLGIEPISVITLICIFLFIGAMGKSAQMPLHVWLPDSMEGPTPISALIHAATMVTAGIFMVARMSPLFEYSETALNFILIVGASTAIFMGCLGLVQHDIKRVIAYSTLSQLGYMVTALGVSAYSAAMFHLITHAFFKALLFLAAGAVIVVMHHKQDMREMGELYKRMPITWILTLIGSLALIGFPGTSGFFSKDLIIQAVQLSDLPAAQFAYYAVLGGVFFTALYSARLFFMTFHGKSRADTKMWLTLREAPYIMIIPLIVLAIPSLFLGWLLFQPILLGGYFGDSIYIAPEHDVIAQLGSLNASTFLAHAFLHPAVLILMSTGILVAWFCYIKQPDLPAKLASKFNLLYRFLINKYGFDQFYQWGIVGGIQKISRIFWQLGDVKLIDGLIVNGVAIMIGRFSARIRHFQSGYLYHYAFVMIIGLLILLAVFVHNLI